MSGDGERNYLTIVALVIALILVIAFTAGFIVWHRHANHEPFASPSPASSDSSTIVASTPTALPTATATMSTPDIITDFGTPRASTTIDPKHLALGVTPGTMLVPLSEDAGTSPERTIARMRSGFRFCYNKGLVKDPNLEGKITLAITVAASGDVTNVTKTGGINAEVDDCLMRRARAATFDASPSSHTVNVPLTFMQAH